MATLDDVLRVAKLARLRIPDSELETIQRKFSAVLNYFEFLAEANTEGVPPLYHGVAQMELREDSPEPALSREELLRNAPDQMENCFKIPKVVGEIE